MPPLQIDVDLLKKSNVIDFFETHKANPKIATELPSDDCLSSPLLSEEPFEYI